VAAYRAACRPPDGIGESPCSLALANMTGANRLLIGIAGRWWCSWWSARGAEQRPTEVVLDRSRDRAGVPRSPRRTADAAAEDDDHCSTRRCWWDLRRHTIRIASAPTGNRTWAPRYLGTFADGPRRVLVGGLFLFAALLILLVARPLRSRGRHRT
jgi:hypothetical protein